jgi:hypothetical protein
MLTIKCGRLNVAYSELGDSIGICPLSPTPSPLGELGPEVL